LGVVLRLWGLGRPLLEFDEAFTATTARIPVGKLFAFLRHNDSHPPLDYLLRKPLADAHAGELALRLPSVVFSVGALILIAWWLRRARVLALVATTLMAVSAFQLRYGREARMYAAMVLVGLAAAVLAERWLRGSERKISLAAGGVLAAGLFLHVSAFLLAAGLLLVPGRRTDREAWWWRGSVLAALALWAALWGPSFSTQSQSGHTSFVAVTPSSVLDTLARLTGAPPALGPVVLVVVVAGGAVLWQRHPRVGVVFVTCFAVPFALGLLVGLRNPFLYERSFAFASWAPLVAVAAVVAELARHRAALGVAGAAMALLLLLPATPDGFLVRPSGRSGLPLAYLHPRTAAGDAVAISPRWLGPLLDWYLGDGGGKARPLRLPGDVHALVLGGRAWDGRVWLVENRRFPPAVDGDPCPGPAAPATVPVRCLVRPS
jgi:mannosyltransferase